MTRLTTKQLAARLGMSVQTVRLMAQGKQIPSLLIKGASGKYSYYFYEEILKERGILNEDSSAANSES